MFTKSHSNEQDNALYWQATYCFEKIVIIIIIISMGSSYLLLLYFLKLLCKQNKGLKQEEDEK